MEQQPKLDPLTETMLRSLADIATPAPISWMPQTWGWLALAILLAAALLVWCALAYRRWRRNAYRREALLRLADIEAGMRRPETRQGAIIGLGELVKRTALAAWPRQDVAPLAGARWVDFLQQHDRDDGEKALKLLYDDIEYRGAKAIEDLPSNVTDDLVRSARRWIERHHVSA